MPQSECAKLRNRSRIRRDGYTSALPCTRCWLSWPGSSSQGFITVVLAFSPSRPSPVRRSPGSAGAAGRARDRGRTRRSRTRLHRYGGDAGYRLRPPRDGRLLARRGPWVPAASPWGARKEAPRCRHPKTGPNTPNRDDAYPAEAVPQRQAHARGTRARNALSNTSSVVESSSVESTERR